MFQSLLVSFSFVKMDATLAKSLMFYDYTRPLLYSARLWSNRQFAAAQIPRRMPAVHSRKMPAKSRGVGLVRSCQLPFASGSAQRAGSDFISSRPLLAGLCSSTQHPTNLWPCFHLGNQVLGRDRRRVVEALGQYPVRCRVDVRLIACEL